MSFTFITMPPLSARGIDTGLCPHGSKVLPQGQETRTKTYQNERYRLLGNVTYDVMWLAATVRRVDSYRHKINAAFVDVGVISQTQGVDIGN